MILIQKNERKKGTGDMTEPKSERERRKEKEKQHGKFRDANK